MKQFNVVIGENGRMIIPALIRRQLNINAGDEVLVKLSPDNDIIVHTPRQSLHKLQKLFKNTKRSFVKDLIDMRKKEDK